MTRRALGAEQADALGELVNVAMGQAGDALSRLLGSFVKLTSPEVVVVRSDEVPERVSRSVAEPEEASAITQAFYNSLRGESVVLFGAEGIRQLMQRLHRDLELEGEDDTELLLDTGNIVSGAILSSLGNQLQAQFDFSPPSVLGLGRPVEELFGSGARDWGEALVVDVHFEVEESDFTCLVVLLMPEQSIDTVRNLVDAILDEY